MKYAIGLDCGISSVGFAVMDLDTNDEPCRIINLGSRVFDKAENPKDGASLALPRREARGNRRRLRRHHHRIERIKYLIVSSNMLSQNELEELYDGKQEDIYELRTSALDNRLSNSQFAKVLINLAQRRGFKSNRKNDTDKEAGLLLSAVSENEKLMYEKGYRTVGEMLYKDEIYSLCKRNKGENYKNTVSRKMVEDEIHKIFEAQRKRSNPFASEEFEKKYSDIVLSQRPFDEGPGEGNENSPSPYAGNQIEKMIGPCTLFGKEGQKRAAKATMSFQKFTLWQNINHIKVVSEFGEARKLTDAERKKIYELCMKSPSVNYAKIRKEIELPAEYRFNMVPYSSVNDADDAEKKKKFEYMKAYHEIRKALDKFKKGYISNLSDDELDKIGYVFTVFKNDEQIRKSLTDNSGNGIKIDDFLVDVLIDNLKSFSKFGHISEYACQKLIPFLEQGMTYDKACEAAGIDFKGHSGNEKSKLLPSKSDELDEIANPVVRRAVSQSIKVINSIIRQQREQPVYINIEVARELSKSFQERSNIEKQYEANRKNNQAIIDELKENYGILYPSGMDIVKLKLYKEQNGICLYSGKAIDASRLFSDSTLYDIDHIIPYSISYDDSYNNKVLVLSDENRQKGNRLPLQYLSSKQRDDFIVRVNTQVRNFRKKKNLLKENLTKDDREGFKTRALNDTKYLSRFLLNYINDYLEFSPFENTDRKKHTTAVNGATTSYMRKRWGIEKIRENGDLHHAVDAAVIACTNESLIQRVSKYSKCHEGVQYSDNGELSVVVDNEGVVKDYFPTPYENFRWELETRTSDDPKSSLERIRPTNYSPVDIAEVKPCFVSRMPNHKTTGAAHKDTIRSGREDGYVITKTDLSSLKLDKDGEILNYYKKESDWLLYNALKKRLVEFGGDGKKAFGQGYVFHKPTSNGGEGPVVKKVKIIEKSTLNVLARGDKGIAANGDMVRIDVFKVEGEGYYFVPIYVADTVKPKLPNKACVQNKPYSDWKEMKDEDFVFSLYNNDLIKVTAKKDMKMTVNFKDSTLPLTKTGNELMLYYVSAGISVASITVRSHDNSYKIDSLGIKTLVNLEKYTVDPIGNYHKVGKEKRMRFR